MEQKDRLKGTLRNGEDDLDDKDQLKNEFIRYHRNLFRMTAVFRNCLSQVCNTSVKFQMKRRKLSRRRPRSPKY